MEKNMNSWECDKLFASEASGPQKNLKMGLGGNLKFCGYGDISVSCSTQLVTTIIVVNLMYIEGNTSY